MSICSIVSSSLRARARRSARTDKVHHDQVERFDAVRGERMLILRIVTAPEDAAEDFGMKRFHTTVHHFRKAGVIGDITHREPLLDEKTPRAAGAVDFDSSRGQPVRIRPARSCR